VDSAKTDTPGSGHIQRTHQALIEALRRVDSVCRELGVVYWVDGGTLLGAVRHQGPIPWDDDVDLCMLREDLYRFLTGAPVLLGPLYCLKTPDDDPAIPVAAKVYINGTHIRSKVATLHDLPAFQHDGLYIDIILMDPVSRWAIVRRLDRSMAWLVTTRPWARSMAHSPGLKSFKTRLRWIVLSRVPRFAVASVRWWLDWRVARRDGSLLGVGLVGSWNAWPYPRDSIFPLIRGTFADLSVPMPSDTNAYLTGEYDSDYMTLPPEGQRITHTDQVLFDES
jgi:lipopolysaccharide cholinephosphotransferase